MYHEEHALPAFVHGRSRDQLKLPFMLLKGETPVIYFYTKEKHNVRVGVGFPRGIWTQWYPQAAVVLPPLQSQAEQSAAQRRPDLLVRRSRPTHRRCLIPRAIDPPPPPGIHHVLPETSSDALWNHARDVDAAFVKTIDGARPAGRRVREVPSSTAAWAMPLSRSTSRKAAAEPSPSIPASSWAMASETSSSCAWKMAAVPTATALPFGPAKP